MPYISRLVFVGVLLGTFIAVPDVYAHRPESGSAKGITEIPDPNTSFAYYRELDVSDPVHIYRFEAQAGQFFHAGINIPQIRGLEDFGVTLALLGPGLPPLAPAAFQLYDAEPHADRATQVPVSLMADLGLGANGGLVVESEKSKDFFEPFTQTRYWGRQMVELSLPESGTYHLLVWNQEGKAGKYVLDTGTQEVFGPLDLFRFPVWWVSTRIFFEQTPQLVGALMIILSGAVGLVVYRRRR